MQQMYIHVKFSFPLHFNRIKKKKSPKKIVVWVGKGVHPIRSERGGVSASDYQSDQQGFRLQLQNGVIYSISAEHDNYHIPEKPSPVARPA